MSFDKTAIDEANKHLLAMNKRVVELGALLNDKTVRLENIEKENQVDCHLRYLITDTNAAHCYGLHHCINCCCIQAKIEAIIRQKDAEIEKRSAWLESTQAEIRRLKIEMTQKDGEMIQLRRKAGILEKVSR